MNKPHSSLGANLQRLRLGLGLSQNDLAEKVAMSRIGYSKLERGDVEPRLDTMQRLACFFNVKIDALLEEVPTFRAIRFRANKTLTSRDRSRRDSLLISVAKCLRGLNALEQALDCSQELSISAYGNTEPVKVATAVREQLNLGEKPIIGIAGLLFNRGIKVLRVDGALKGFFGFSLGRCDGGPAIVVNVHESISYERRIFTVAHELGHLLMHNDAYHSDVESAESVDEEKSANTFASHFLMPNDLFVDTWNKASSFDFYKRVINVKRVFSVSYKSVLYRLSELTGKNYHDLDVMFQNAAIRLHGKQLGTTEEPEPLLTESGLGSYRLAEFRDDYAMSVIYSGLQKGLINIIEAADVMGVSADRMKEIVDSWGEDANLQIK